ncbi:tetratricopeptide repeat protein [Streptomyces albiflavescens]|nr:tetratricopeptide repeat protein [Streptomyces albiflavescens]
MHSPSTGSTASKALSAGSTKSKDSSSANRVLQDTNLLMQTGILQEKQHDSEGAARTYRRVLELDPGNKFAWYSLGAIAQQSGRTADARADYEKALKIDPSFVSALNGEANLLAASEPDRAIDLLNRAVAADPKAATTHLQLGLLLAKEDRNDEAEAAFRRAVAADHQTLSQVPEEFRDSVSTPPTSSHAGSSR